MPSLGFYAPDDGEGSSSSIGRLLPLYSQKATYSFSDAVSRIRVATIPRRQLPTRGVPASATP